MIIKEKHQKHKKLNRPSYGEFGRNELAILGTSCGTIQSLAKELILELSMDYKLAFVDADHKEGDRLKEVKTKEKTILDALGSMQMTDKILYKRIDFNQETSVYDQRVWFNKQDLVLVNGNHFKAASQVLVIDSKKSLEKKLDKIEDVQLFLLKDSSETVPQLIKDKLPHWESIPCCFLEETSKIISWTKEWLEQRIAPVNGLVLSGGKSTRMKKDKGTLAYHGKSQREYVVELLQPLCREVYLSCNQEQAVHYKDKFPIIEDKYLDLGPMGGILSAFMSDPNAAWLSLAIDLPYLTSKTIQHLMNSRNPSKMATAFMDPKGEFPEPLITIWEPRSYPVLLQFLSQGYTCPRKMLINSEVELLQAPDTKELQNINNPEEYEEVMKELNLK